MLRHGFRIDDDIDQEQQCGTSLDASSYDVYGLLKGREGILQSKLP